MHILHKILTERNEEENAQDATQCGGDENLDEVGLQVEHVDGGHNKDAASNNSARASSDALDNDVLAQRILAVCGRRETNGDDGNGNGGLKHLSHL